MMKQTLSYAVKGHDIFFKGIRYSILNADKGNIIVFMAERLKEVNL